MHVPLHSYHIPNQCHAINYIRIQVIFIYLIPVLYLKCTFPYNLIMTRLTHTVCMHYKPLKRNILAIYCIKQTCVSRTSCDIRSSLTLWSWERTDISYKAIQWNICRMTQKSQENLERKGGKVDEKMISCGKAMPH